MKILNHNHLQLFHNKHIRVYLYNGDKYEGYPYDIAPNKNGFYLLPKQIVIKDIKQYEPYPYVNYQSLADIKEISPDELKSFPDFGNISPYKPATKLFIFGAGASYDFDMSGSAGARKKFPLTKELFDDHYKDYCKEFPVLYKQWATMKIKATNLEKYFESEYKKTKEYYHPETSFKLLSVQYYLGHLFRSLSNDFIDHPESCYQTLVDLVNTYSRRNNEKVLMVNFNYDTLLDNAFETTLNVQLKDLNSYTNEGNRLLYYKPHGSSNWYRKINIETSSELQLYIAAPLKYFALKNLSYGEVRSCCSESVTVIGSVEDGIDNSQYGILKFPELLIPYSDKDDFVMPNNHKLSLDRNLTTVNDIFIIGWKGGEETFLKKLKEKAVDVKRVFCVCYDNRETAERIFSILPHVDIYFFNSISPKIVKEESTFFNYAKAIIESDELIPEGFIKHNLETYSKATNSKLKFVG